MTHQAKRAYVGSQPSITSYFPSTTSSFHSHYNVSSNQASPSTNESCFPAPPPSVQSNLLNVGMRVRKSVPEGYKTGTYSAFFNENTSTPPAPVQKIASKTRPRARELTPFCGILKVGGMAHQAWGIYNPSGGIQAHDGRIYSDEEMDEDEDEDEDDIPFLSSQGSTISNTSVTTPSRENKRRYFEDGEEDAEDTKTSFVDRGSGERVMAVPKRKGWGGKLSGRAGQENITVAGEDFDFQDAEFLDYGLVGEVEMSG